MTANNTTIELTGGFIDFGRRDWSRKADRYTWARFDAKTRKLTVCYGGSGKMSADYYDDMVEFCNRYGIDFDAMHRNERVTVIVPDEQPAAVDTETAQPAAEAVEPVAEPDAMQDGPLMDCLNALMAEPEAKTLWLLDVTSRSAGLATPLQAPVRVLKMLEQEAIGLARRFGWRRRAPHYTLREDGIYYQGELSWRLMRRMDGKLEPISLRAAA